jgi:gas vesicle protein GvpN
MAARRLLIAEETAEQVEGKEQVSMPYEAEAPILVSLEPEEGFVETPQIANLTQRALAYLKAGFPVHFSGLAGTGKTTLSMHLARKLGQPTMLICGDDELGSSNLIGGQHGYRMRKVVDRFIHSVLKMEEDVRSRWVDARLTQACREGFTLIYDEFNRSRPEANNVLLGILEERILPLPPAAGEDDEILEVNPNFRAIFTSNPEEYAGVHKTQDALRDRMVTLELDHFDEDTEIAITQARSGASREEAQRIVALVRALRELHPSHSVPTVRSCIIIAKTLKIRAAHVHPDDPAFREICFDVLSSESGKPEERRLKRQETLSLIERLVQTHCR